MSVEAIVHAVEVTAAAEGDAIVGAARSDAASIVAAAQAAAVARVREACERADPGFRAEAMRQVNTARLRLLERRAARSAELVNAATDAARVRLAELAANAIDPRWAAALERLLEETAALIGPNGTMRVRSVDLPAARAVGARLGCQVEPFHEGTGADVPGVIGRSADGRVEVDATLPVRLAHARIRFAEPVARLLGVDA